MGVLSGFLHSGHAINIVLATLNLLAGLSGFESLLAKKSGALRQVIVAFPALLLYAVLAYLLNALSHDFYARIYQMLFSLPSANDGLQIFVIQFALYGFMLPFLLPNVYRKESDYDHRSPLYLIIYVVLQTISKTITFAVLLLIANTGHRLLFGIQLSNAGIFIASILFSLIAISASIKSASIVGVQWALRRPIMSRENSTSPVPAPGCLLYLALIVTYFLDLTAVLVVGWAVIVYILLLFVLHRLISALQRLADSMSLDTLRKVFLTLFLVNNLLLLAQAIQ